MYVLQMLISLIFNVYVHCLYAVLTEFRNKTHVQCTDSLDELQKWKKKDASVMQIIVLLISTS